MKREQISENYKWDLSDYCKNEQEFLSRAKNMQRYIELFSKFEGTLENDENLKKVLDLSSESSLEAEILATYAQRIYDLDLTNDRAKENVDLISKIFSDISVASSFLVPEVSAFSDEKLKSLVKDPKFRRHKLFFKDIIKQKPHILAKPEEKLLSGMGEFLGGFSENQEIFSDADLKFDKVKDQNGVEHEFNQSLYSVFMSSPDRELRKNTFKSINGAYGKFINFLANNYLSDVKAGCYFAKIRNYPSALLRAIETEQASEKVYNNLIKSIHKNLDFFYEYYDKKRQKLGLSKIAIYDAFAPVSKTSERRYDFETAMQIVAKATEVLGEEYSKTVQRAFKERWIDAMPSDNKHSGAYATCAYGKHPLMLMNFSGDLYSVLTLAHELGHDLHYYFSTKHQIYEESENVIFVAEVASTVNEMLVTFQLLKKAESDYEKLELLDRVFENVKSTIFRQTMFAEFEAWVHEEYENSRPLSKERLCQKYFDLNKLYFGSEVELTDETKFEWARIPHFFRSFYVYKYATGMICALNISSKILSGEKDAVKKYMRFLSAGCTKDPVSLLKDAGCDLEETKTFDEAFNLLRDLLKQY